MPFQPINKPRRADETTTTGSRPEASSSSLDGVRNVRNTARTSGPTDGNSSSDAERLSLKPPASKESRDWPVDELDGKRITEDKQLEYRVKFLCTKERRDRIKSYPGGSMYAKFSGRRWTIERIRTASPEPQTGADRCLVDWEPAWLTVYQLRDAPDSINDYEARMSTSLSGSVNVVIPSIEPNDLQSVFLVGYEPYGLPEQTPTGLKFQPLLGHDYTVGVKTMLVENLGPNGGSKQLQSLLKSPIRRPLVFDDAFANNDSTMHVDRAERRNAALVFMAGEERPKCEACAKGRGPFRCCVNMIGFTADACATCAYLAEGPKCMYHHSSMSLPHFLNASADSFRTTTSAHANRTSITLLSTRALCIILCFVVRILCRRRRTRRRRSTRR
jgi:hypothetical protein